MSINAGNARIWSKISPRVIAGCVLANTLGKMKDQGKSIWRKWSTSAFGKTTKRWWLEPRIEAANDTPPASYICNRTVSVKDMPTMFGCAQYFSPGPPYTHEKAVPIVVCIGLRINRRAALSPVTNVPTYSTSVWLVMMFSRWLISAPTNVILSVEAEDSFCCRCATYRQTVVNYDQTEPTLNFISLFSQISCVGCLVLASLAPNQTFPLIWRVPKTK